VTREEVHALLEGSHPGHGRRLALLVQAVLVLSAVVITLRTLRDLPGWLPPLLGGVEWAIILLFALEYAARLWSAPDRLRYALSFWGLIDLLACLPILSVINPGWAALRTVRLIRLAALLKLLRANRTLARLAGAFQDARDDLAVFALLAGLMLFIASVGIWVFEHDAQPDTFGTIPNCFWWAVVSFTTVGYGDAYPITAGGRLFTAIILFVGLGVIAVPSAVITSALIAQNQKEREQDDKFQDHSPHRLGPRRPRPGRGDRRPRR